MSAQTGTETFEGSVSAEAGAGEVVTITVTKPDGTQAAPIMAQTDASGNFTATYTDVPGSYSAVASIGIDADNAAAASDPFLFALTALQARTISLSGSQTA